MYEKPRDSVGRALVICYNYEEDVAQTLPFDSKKYTVKIKDMLRGLNFKVDVQYDTACTKGYKNRVCI